MTLAEAGWFIVTQAHNEQTPPQERRVKPALALRVPGGGEPTSTLLTRSISISEVAGFTIAKWQVTEVSNAMFCRRGGIDQIEGREQRSPAAPGRKVRRLSPGGEWIRTFRSAILIMLRKAGLSKTD
jgi:hypothetical protein